MTENVTVTKVINQVQIASDGPQGPTGPTGSSGVISVTAPITNSGSSTSAVIGINAGVANGVATLDSGGKIPQSQIPAVAITNTFVVASQAAMLALTAEEGDVAVRTDLNKTYILTATPSSTLANWQELLTPTDAVQSVDGRTGTVTLSDLYAAKTHASTHAAAGSDPVTLAQSQITNLTTDLAAKAPLASPTFTGTVTIPAGSSISGVPYLATANTFTTSPQQINGASSAIGLIVRANATTPGNLQEWQNSAGTAISYVTSTGSFIAQGMTIVGSTNASGAVRTLITTTAAANIPLAIRGAASQTADLQQWQNSAGTVLVSVNSSGDLLANSSLTQAARFRYFDNPNVAGSYIDTQTSIGVIARSTSAITFYVRGAASQTANLQEWRDSAGTVLSRITASGVVQGVIQTLNAYVRLQEQSGGGSVQYNKCTSAAGSPGADKGVLYFRDGTNAGTLKLVVRAGAAGAETTILDNIPQ